jgi:hypothetical protein
MLLARACRTFITASTFAFNALATAPAYAAGSNMPWEQPLNQILDSVHIAALRCDGVLPELLGMNKIVSEDAVRRAFAAIDEDDGAMWVRRHLDYCPAPLLAEPWILDIDTTVKPLYGHQPKKPGRPSHSYHTYSMAGARLVFDVDVVAGNEHTSKHFSPGLWALLDIGFHAIYGRRCCVPMPASATSRSCAKRNDGAWPICSSCD